MDLTEALNKAAGGNKPRQQEEGKKTVAQPSGKKRETNRSITCSYELRDRLRIMAATKGVPMQALLEEWMTEKLEAAGF